MGSLRRCCRLYFNLKRKKEGRREGVRKGGRKKGKVEQVRGIRSPEAKVLRKVLMEEVIPGQRLETDESAT